MSSTGSETLAPGTAMVRIAVVLHPSLEAGEASNVASVLAGGLRCDGFAEPIADATGIRHVAILGNVVVLRAKTTGQLSTLVATAASESLECVVFTRHGQQLSNQFALYRRGVADGDLNALGLIGVGLFGADEVVRRATRQFSLFR